MAAAARVSASSCERAYKDHAAIRLYERLGAVQVATLTHHYGDGLTEPAAVYVVPS
jgi:ribosomal protein S18 acetylase RimI-like enzyme